MVRWLPLESNPAVMNKFISGLGVPDAFQCTDVYGLDDELLAMVPQPVLSLILLHPLGEKEEEFKKQQEEKLEADGQELSENLYFMQQFVGNACGTVALIHAIANNIEKIGLKEGPLKDFVEKTSSMDPEKRGQALEEDEGISKAHEESAQEGQTEAPDRDAKLDMHFVAFVEVDGTLYELDGRKKFPINHGATTPETLLKDSAEACREFIKREPDEARFALVALASAE